MIEQINVTKNLTVNADQAWAAISSIGGLERWFPIIADCSVLGAGVGASRFLTLVDGGKITDRIDTIDHQQRSLRYNRIESQFPVQSYLGTVNISKVHDNSAKLSWIVAIDVQEEQREAMVELIRRAITDGVDGLEQDLQQRNIV
ncbi:SRPBCC family protein [Methylobacter psychrophilus]|uniref:SRPBCC family protein n=1 Tax=Methylobacter psychrophilus TaxID=96941 RepID=UPI0021D4E2B9|nr:SRPBCC family protein [Methylobacter psychrophilus]